MDVSILMSAPLSVVHIYLNATISQVPMHVHVILVSSHQSLDLFQIRPADVLTEMNAMKLNKVTWICVTAKKRINYAQIHLALLIVFVKMVLNRIRILIDQTKFYAVILTNALWIGSIPRTNAAF